jgi:hypothetical protein
MNFIHATHFEGDVAQCVAWLGYARGVMRQMLSGVPRVPSKVIRPADGVEITIRINPNQIFIKTGSEKVFITIQDALSPYYQLGYSNAELDVRDRFIFKDKTLITTEPPPPDPLSPIHRELPLPRFDPVVTHYTDFLAGSGYWVSANKKDVVSWLDHSVFIGGNKVIFDADTPDKKILCCFIKNKNLLVISGNRIDADTVRITNHIFSFDNTTEEYVIESTTTIATYKLGVYSLGKLDGITVVAESTAVYVYVSVPSLDSRSVSLAHYKVEDDFSLTLTNTVVYDNATMINTRSHAGGWEGENTNNTVTEVVNVSGSNVFCGLFSNVGGVYLMLADTIDNTSTRIGAINTRYALDRGNGSESFNVDKSQINKILILKNGVATEAVLNVELTNSKTYSRSINANFKNNNLVQTFSITESNVEENNRLLFYSSSDDVLIVLNEKITHTGNENIVNDLVTGIETKTCLITTKTDTKITGYKKGVVFFEVEDSNTVERTDYIDGFQPVYGNYEYHLIDLFRLCIYTVEPKPNVPTDFDIYTNYYDYTDDNTGNKDGTETWFYGRLATSYDFLRFNSDARNYKGDGAATACISDTELIFIEYAVRGVNKQVLVNMKSKEKQWFAYDVLDKPSSLERISTTLTTYKPSKALIGATYFSFL